MLSSDECFKIKHTLDALYQSVGESEFGYRIQGLLAHVFLRLGGKIVNIKPQGHPDITVNLAGRTLLIQAKSVMSKARRQAFAIEAEDVEGIRPCGSTFVGYLAVLDCALPVSWILVSYQKLCRQGLAPVHMATLCAMADEQLSFECSDEFAKLILNYQSILPKLAFRILSGRALRGDAL